ncbi:MAG: hypothetical protein IJ073_07270 [Lachnospiraceae bacterium]|nr:hypothetical protein [Lachnospiraceae bacterium]
MNYIILLQDGRVFGGWNPVDGQILILPPERIQLAYRMQRTVAERTLSKIADFTAMDCRIEKLAA